MSKFKIVKLSDSRKIAENCRELENHEVANMLVLDKDGADTLYDLYWNDPLSSLLHVYVCNDKIVVVSYRWRESGKEQQADLYIDMYKKLDASELLE